MNCPITCKLKESINLQIEWQKTMEELQRNYQEQLRLIRKLDMIHQKQYGI